MTKPVTGGLLINCNSITSMKCESLFIPEKNRLLKINNPLSHNIFSLYLLDGDLRMTVMPSDRARATVAI